MTDKTKQEKWEDEFDKKFRMNMCDEEYICAGNNSYVIKQFISEKIEELKHDHEILVNTILETKNKEIEEAKKEAVSEYDKSLHLYALGGSIAGIGLFQDIRKQALEKRGIRE